MRLVVQRVSHASVTVGEDEVGVIGGGFLVLAGAEPEDGPAEIDAAVDKLMGLRVFADELGKMNLDIGTVGGEILVVSQFTLLADVRRGRRPSFAGAAEPDHAQAVIGQLVEGLKKVGISTATGVFGAKMNVSLVNEGPVTLVLDFKNGRLV